MVDKDAAASAVTAMINQPELTHGVGYGLGATIADWEAPHVSHDMCHIVTATSTAIFCNTCGKWSKRNAHSKLPEECSGECNWKGGLNLPRHCIFPVQGAKMPASKKAPPGVKK